MNKKKKLAQQQVCGLHCVVGKKVQLEVSTGNGGRLRGYVLLALLSLLLLHVMEITRK